MKLDRFLGATKSVINTTSTGVGTAISCPPLSVIAAQVVVNGTGTGSFIVEGSLGGGNWYTIVASSTYADTRLIASSTVPPVTLVRATVTAHGSTDPVTIWLSGK